VAKSGYARVYELLSAHPLVLAAISDRRAILSTVRIASWAVTAFVADSMDPDGNVVFRTHLHVELEADLLAGPTRWSGDARIYDVLLGLERARTVVHDWFGKQVPTYGCKADVVLTGRRSKSGRRSDSGHQESFPSWIEDVVLDYDRNREIRDRVQALTEAVERTEAYAVAAESARREASVSAIAEFLCRFRNADPSVVREGCDRALVDRVLGS
jgi:hypothetical protein